MRKRKKNCEMCMRSELIVCDKMRHSKNTRTQITRRKKMREETGESN